MGYILKKSKKMVKEDNLGMNTIYISMLKKKIIKTKLSCIFTFYLVKKKQKSIKFLFIWKTNLGIKQKKNWEKR